MLKPSFDFVVEAPPIDYFYASLTKEQLIENYKNENKMINSNMDSSDFEEKINSCYESVNEIVHGMSGEYPHTINFFGFPLFDNCDFELCALAKISNNGTTYVFTNFVQFAHFLSVFSGYDLEVKEL